MKKYGRTYHLPMSQGVTNDDKILKDMSAFENSQEVIITEKMDGENTTLHANGCHARSPDSGYHASRDWLKAFAAVIIPNISANERIIGEYLYAKHAVRYDELPSYFLGFAWVVNGVFQPWDDSIKRFAELGITPVPTLFRGVFSDNVLKSVEHGLDNQKQEGFVMRVSTAFDETKMNTHLAKYVRKGHVQTDKHWMHAQIIKNGLK